MISKRVQGFTESVIREMTRVNAEYGGVNLAQGFPNFPPPRELRDLMQQQPRNEEEIQAKITELDQLRGQIEFRRQGILREINAALTLEQRAQFALITETFEVETIRMLEELRLIVEQRRRR